MQWFMETRTTAEGWLSKGKMAYYFSLSMQWFVEIRTTQRVQPPQLAYLTKTDTKMTNDLMTQ